ncbi:MAG: DUF4292 domain-containing protein [Bacteroides sp.]|nr:DUF4292 domain-containing protein [Ruminococcus flavefaciens]MCM1554953.1 DUF4292 domain-containing protein [Bacteroides sp.]
MNKTIKKTIRHAVFLCCCASLLLASCREDRQDTGWRNQDFVLDEDLVRQSRDSVDFILRKAMSRNTRFSTFAANLDIKLNVESYSIGVGGQLRIQKDETIWLSCQKLVFELFRAKITPDTLAFYSKMANSASVYIDDSAKDLLPKSFGLLQALFTRGVDSVMFDGERTLDADSSSWIIGGASDSVAWQLHVGKESFRPESIDIQVAQGEAALQIAVVYQNEKGFEIRISENRKLLVQARISYSKPRWNENISFPFSIPSGIKTEVNHGLLRSLEKSRDSGLMME